MDFIKEIYEARMTRGSNDQRELTYTDVCERLFLSLCILELMYKSPAHKADVIRYAKATVGFNTFQIFRPGATDLHNFIYFVDGDKAAMDKLKNPGAAWLLRQGRYIPIIKLNRYLTAMSYGRAMDSTDKSFLLSMESTLHINNSEYSKVRRDIMNWEKLSSFDAKAATTRLLFASRAKLRNSDLHPMFEKFVSDTNLETMYGVQDNEPTASKSDKDEANRLIMYKYLFGGERVNIPLIKQFLERARNGETIPSHLVKAYAPAIKILDDIVKAGPQYTQMVKIAHKRAKNKP